MRSSVMAAWRRAFMGTDVGYKGLNVGVEGDGDNEGIKRGSA